MGSPKISVIVPTYNVEHFIVRSIESLLSQTLIELEIVIVDDASTDHTAVFIRQLAAKDKRIKAIFKEANEGVYEARRSGIRHASGKRIGFMDADDYVEPDMFQRLMNAAEDTGSDIAICGADRVSPTGERIGMKFQSRDQSLVQDSVFARFCAQEFGTGSLWNKLYSASLVKKHGCAQFRWRQDSNEDTLVNIGCFLDARAVTLLAGTLYHYVDNPLSKTSTNDTARGVTELLRAYALAIETYSNRSMDALKHIDRLYREQLSFSCYYVEDTSSLNIYKSELSEVMRILLPLHPAGIAALISDLGRPRPKSPGSFQQQWKLWLKETRLLFPLAISAVARSCSKTVKLFKR